MTAAETPAPIFAANWKMHLGPDEARRYVERFLAAFKTRSDRTVILCPPAISMEAVAGALRERPDVALGAQNVWSEPKGAFTGETSAPMAAEVGARFVLVGHSERRHVFGETIAQTAAKCAAVVAAGMRPVLCVGETLAQREQEETEEVVLEQLAGGLQRVATGDAAGVIVAYEPVWAIGTGKTATPADASAVHAVIRRSLLQRLGDAGAPVPILYGGSVNAGNAAALVSAPEVSGLLVGGASLDPEGWAAICRT